MRYVLKPDDGVGEGYVMDRLPGETIARKILRDHEFDAVRPDLARQCGEILARIHQVDTAPLQNLSAGCRWAHTVAPLSATSMTPMIIRIPMFELAFKWLEPRLGACRPRKRWCMAISGTAIILISPDGVEAALDWELTHIGDPLEDIGWICTNSWRFGVQQKDRWRVRRSERPACRL